MRSILKPAALVCLLLLFGAGKTFSQFTATITPNGAGPLCAGGIDTLTAVSNLGTPPYNFEWSDGEQTENIYVSPTTSVSYTVTITDGIAQTATASITITVNPRPVANAGTNQTIEGCSPTGGLIGGTPTASGGTGTYTYLWSPNTFLSSPTVADPIVSGITVGETYTVIVTDANGCTASSSVSVSVAAGPQVSITSSGSNTWCAGSATTDNLTATVTGGAAPYQYTWSGADISPANAQIALVNPNIPGTFNYTVTVTDNSGCSSTATTSIDVTNCGTLVVNAGNDTVVCQGNGALLGGSPVAFGGTPPYTYIWNNGVPNVANPVVSPSITTTYTVTVTDNVGNTATGSMTVTVSNCSQALTVSAGSNDTICAGLSVNLTALVNGGAPPYTYSWSGSAANTQIITVQPGLTTTYTVTVTDAASNTATSSVMVIINTGCAAPPVANAGADNTICVGGGPVTLGGAPTATGGTAPYTYAWAPGTGLSSATVANPLASPTTNTTFTVTVTDANNFTATSSVVINVSSCTGALTVSLGNADTICVGNSVTLLATVNGGSAPYTYQWSPVSGISSATTEAVVASPVTTTTYTVTVTDNSSNTATAGITVMVKPVPTSDFTFSTPQCSGNAISVSYTGTGTVSDIYDWNFDGATVISGTGQGPYQIAWNTQGLVSISLSVTSNGCTSASTNSGPIQILPVPTATFTAVSTGCLGTNAIITYTGNEPSSATYTWQFTGGTVVSGSGQGPYVVTWPNGTLNETVALTVTRAGCTSNLVSNPVTVINPLTVTTDSLADTIICNGGSTQICAHVTGGTPGYTFEWSNNTTTACTWVAAGNYVYNVTDAAGCLVTDTVAVSQPAAAFTVAYTPTNVSCYNGGNGSICATPNGGTAPYTYVWSNSATGACLTNLSVASYYITVTDANGHCIADGAINITQPTQLALQVINADSSAVPDTITLIASGGTPPYLYSYDNGQTDITGNGIYNTIGIYMDSVTDASGCVLTYRVDVGCSDSCVWPGDANYDGVVDNNDLLAIGLGYDSTGYTRQQPTINFTPQYCQNWPDTLLGGINYKHVDCNGDGIINATDTDAIMLNYGLTHPRSGGAANWKNNAPALYISVSPDTLIDGETAIATLSLGDVAMPCTNVYALAFTYNFDPLVVDTGSVSISYSNYSWLVDTGSAINISKTFYGPGQLQTALTRTDHINRSGQGPIATASFKVTTGNINGKNLAYYLMNNFISNLTVIDNKGNVLPFNAGSDSVVVSYLPTNITPVSNGNLNIQIFPNPANDVLNITGGLNQAQEISIVDLTGQQVLHQNLPTGNNYTLDISGLSAGVYLINIQTATQQYHNRFVKVSGK